MKKNLKILGVIILIVVVLILGIFLIKGNEQTQNNIGDNVTESRNELKIEEKNETKNEVVVSNNIVDNTMIREPEETIDEVKTNGIATPTEEEDIVSGSTPTI